MNKNTKNTTDGKLTDQEIILRRDEAVRRALNTPPKPHKDMKLGKRKPSPSDPSSKQRGGA